MSKDGPSPRRTHPRGDPWQTLLPNKRGRQGKVDDSLDDVRGKVSNGRLLKSPVLGSDFVSLVASVTFAAGGR